MNLNSRALPIIIAKSENSNKLENKLRNKVVYSLMQNNFDPTKSSPPNNFMIKLKMRMNIYDAADYLSANKTERRDIE